MKWHFLTTIFILKLKYILTTWWFKVCFQLTVISVIKVFDFHFVCLWQLLVWMCMWVWFYYGWTNDLNFLFCFIVFLYFLVLFLLLRIHWHAFRTNLHKYTQKYALQNYQLSIYPIYLYISQFFFSKVSAADICLSFFLFVLL